MAPSTGFKEGRDVVDSCSATGTAGHGAGGMTCPIGHLNSAEPAVTGRAGQSRSAEEARCMHAVHIDSDVVYSSDGVEADTTGGGALSDGEFALAPSPPESVKSWSVVCTIMLTSRTARIPRTRRATTMCC